MKLFRWFKVNGEHREFMYLHSSRFTAEILECIKFVKAQGDIYRTSKSKDGTIYIWDARP